MSRLKVMLRGSLISQVPLNPEKEYIGGRKDGSDIRLQAEKGISREHFKLKFLDGHWEIRAVSRFGDIFSLGQKIEQADLQHGQTFQIPPYEFIFLDVPDSGLPEQAQTNAIPVQYGEEEKTVIGAQPQVPYIKMVSSAGEVREMLRLEVGEVWVAGRDPSCQIIIPDQRVSRRQFEIYKVNGAFTILDLASVNGTFLNGSPVSSTDPQSLKSGDAITVLDNMIYFELHDPNFKYKVERIEVPPLQVSQPEEVYEDLPTNTELMTNPEEIPQIDQYEMVQQLATSDSPFTGMPGGEGFDQNQFYNFQPPPPQPPPVSGMAKLMQNKPMLIALVLVVLGGGFYLSDMLSPSSEPITQAGIGDAFSKLTPAQQKQVLEYYSMAEQMYNQQKYDLALEKIRKIKEVLPSGYKDSEKIELDAIQANLTLIQAARDEEAKREKEELEAKNKLIITACEKLIGPKVSLDAVNQCLAPVIAFDAQNNDVIRLLAEAERIEKDRQQKEAQAKSYEQQVVELGKLFKEAEFTQSQGYAFKAIKKYKLLIGRGDLPDPKKLKEKARERITFIQQKIKEKSEGSINLADNLFSSGNLRDAVMTLREAKIYDPENAGINEKILLYSIELKKQVRTIYQDSIIDENFGFIENTETKQGAKEKWKKITDLDLEDGEYYRKAVIKLHRYGIM